MLDVDRAPCSIIMGGPFKSKTSKSMGVWLWLGPVK